MSKKRNMNIRGFSLYKEDDELIQKLLIRCGKNELIVGKSDIVRASLRALDQATSKKLLELVNSAQVKKGRR